MAETPLAGTFLTNTPENLDVQTFISHTTKDGGPARVSRFIASITPCPLMLSYSDYSKELSYLCETTEIPGRGFQTTDIRYYGPSFKSPFNVQYDDLTFIFIVRTDFREREYFDIWLNNIQPINEYNFKYRKDYVTNIDLFQLSDLPDGDKFAAKYKVTLSEAYPIAMASQQLVWGEDNFHRLSITFNYKRWYRNEDEIKTNKFKLVEQSMITSGGTFIPGNSYFAPG